MCMARHGWVFYFVHTGVVTNKEGVRMRHSLGLHTRLQANSSFFTSVLRASTLQLAQAICSQ